VHRIDDAQFGQTLMRDFFDRQRFGNDADDFAARRQNRVGDFCPSNRRAAAVNEFDILIGEKNADRFRRLQKSRIRARVRAAKNTNSFHIYSGEH
jgi:hypothetical protein